LRQAYDYWQNQPDCQLDFALAAQKKIHQVPRGRKVRGAEAPRTEESCFIFLDSNQSMHGTEKEHCGTNAQAVRYQTTAGTLARSHGIPSAYPRALSNTFR